MTRLYTLPFEAFTSTSRALWKEGGMERGRCGERERRRYGEGEVWREGGMERGRCGILAVGVWRSS